MSSSVKRHPEVETPQRQGEAYAASSPHQWPATVVQWYEFFLYATAATLVFNKIFFPDNGNDLDNIIKAFLTYAVGFIARPIGGIVFGHFGDKYGRKHLLQVAIVLVGATTFLMGCLPTFHSVGYAAPIMLVALRFLQGFAVGGEWGGAVLLVAEHAPSKERGFWASWPQAAVPVGNLLATVVLLVLSSTLSDEAFLAWGWRIGFWLSVIIVIVGYYIRTRVSDAPIFQEAKAELEQNAAVGYGVGEVFKRYPRGVFTAMGLRFGENIMYYMVVTFSITYMATQLKMVTSTILGLMLIAHVIHAILVPLVGRFTDTRGRRPVYATGVILMMVWGVVAFPMFDTANLGIILAAIVLGLAIHALMYAGQPAIMAEMFPTRMRYSGVSLGYQVHLDRGRFHGTDHRLGAAEGVRVVDPGRDLHRDRRRDHADRRGCAARDPRLVAARSSTTWTAPAPRS